MADSAQQLKQAINFIKAGDKATAIKVITAVIKNDKNNATAWFLMATALSDREQKIKALENALRIQPGYTRAHEMLDKLRPPAPPPPPPQAAIFDDDDDDPFGDAANPFGDDDAVFDDDDPFASSADFDEADEDFSEFEGDDLSQFDPRLIEAAEIIQSGGSKKEAGKLITAVLKDDDTDAEAWFLLANALENEEKQIRALEKTLSLNPGHADAADMLARLQGDDPFGDDDFYDEDVFDDAGFGTDETFADDPFGDPFVDVSPTDAKKPSFAFEFMTFVLMLVVGVGAYFGLSQIVGQPGNVLGSVLDDLDSLDDTLGFGSPGFSMGGDCQPANVAGNETVRRGLYDVIVRGAIQRGESRSGYRGDDFEEGFTYNATAGESLTIRAVPASDFDVGLAVYDAGGARVDQIDIGFAGAPETLNVTFQQAGEYLIIVWGFLNSCGNYTLTVN